MASIHANSAGDSACLVRSAQLADVQQIVDVHQKAFTGFFLTSLGGSFLRELYRGFINDVDSICLVAEAGERVVGFVVGTVAPENFFRRLLLRRAAAFVLAGFAGLARRPLKVGGRFLAAVRYRGETPSGVSDATLLSSIGVDPSCGVRGAGTALVRAFIEAAAARGAQLVYLTTDAASNDSVNRFYTKCGFNVDEAITRRDGRAMYRYIQKVQPRAEHANA